jgi:hypothetical protein
MTIIPDRTALRMVRSLPLGAFAPALAGWNMRCRVIDSNQFGLSSHWPSHGQVLWDESPSSVFREAQDAIGLINQFLKRTKHLCIN